MNEDEHAGIESTSDSNVKNPTGGLLTVMGEAVRSGGIYVIPGAEGKPPVPLTDAISIIRESRGTFESLGLAYDPAVGANTMVLAFVATVPCSSRAAVDLFGVGE